MTLVTWALLDEVPDEDRKRFLSLARRRRFAKSEIVFHEGDTGDSLHLVASGRFAARVTTAMGETTMLAVMGAGDFFGELALIGTGDRRAATVVALERAESLCVTRDSFERLRREHASVDRVLVAVLASQIRTQNDLLVEALHDPVEVRILRRLLSAAEAWGGAKPGVAIPLTQEDVAGLAGTTRPTVNRILRQSAEAGMLRIHRGRIELLDLVRIHSKAKLRMG